MPVNRAAKPLPGIFMYKEEVNEKVINFLNGKHQVLSSAIGKPESKSGWYSLQQFEELMREIYYLNADGLRIYFGAYGSEDPEYANQLTIIFVPTYWNEITGKHTDIIIDDENNFPDRCESQYKKISGTITKNLNTVGLCPPTCDGHLPGYPL